MRASKTTIQDIARELQVTPSTVSRALNNHGSISEAMKKAVASTAQKLQYSHNKIASSLRLGKTKILGVIIPSAEINFFGSVVHGIEKIAREKGYSILMFQSNEQPECERLGVDTFLRSRVDGVLISVSKETTDFSHLLELKKRHVPLIVFDRANDELDIPSVTIDDYAGAYKATKHLLEQGCSRIAHIGGQQHVSIFKQRLKGYVDAMKDWDHCVEEELIRFGRVSIESGKQCMEELLLLAEAPDGVFAVEDFTALGALQALKGAGKKVPDEVALIGFANEAFGAYITPSLSTVDQQTIRMGEEAAQIFFDHAAQTDFYNTAPQKKILEPVLVYRASSLKKKVASDPVMNNGSLER